MTVPILVEQTDGEFCASLVGAPKLRCTGTTRSEAIAALQSELGQKVATGELVTVEVPLLGVSGLAGRFADDPSLKDICDQIYHQREMQRSRR
jgi:hypothetical protein